VYRSVVMKETWVCLAGTGSFISRKMNVVVCVRDLIGVDLQEGPRLHHFSEMDEA